MHQNDVEAIIQLLCVLRIATAAIMMSLLVAREGDILLHAIPVERTGVEDEDVHATLMGEIITIMIDT